jgi:uncharacterized damage-inducible protein DinB
MTTLIEQQYDRLARWDQWANRLVFEVLRASDGEPANALAAFQHVLETEVNWLRRLEGVADANPPLWIEPSLAQCEAYAAEVDERLDRVAADLDSTRLESAFSYANSHHHEFTNTIADALLHMFMHSMQYRGEAAAFLNAAGHRVPDFDLIFWQRTGGPA